MKINIIINSISVLIIIVFTTTGCSKSNESSINDKSKKESSINIYKEIKEDAYRERICLLALKYGIDEPKATSIIKEYNKIIDRPNSLTFLTIEKARLENKLIEIKKTDYIEIIDKMSSKYNMPKNEIAAFIIDLKKWQLSESARYE